MLDKMNHINNVDGSLRRFVTHEPRACAQMSVNLLIAPTRPDADAGFIVLQSDRAHADVRQQLHVRRDGSARDRPGSDAGAGDHRPPGYAGGPRGRACPVRGWPLRVGQPRQCRRVRGGAGQDDRDAERWGRIKADIAFGGIYYAIVDVDQLGIAIDPKNARALAEAGIQLKDDLAKQVAVRHPDAGRPERDRLRHVPRASSRTAPSAPAPRCGPAAWIARPAAPAAPPISPCCMRAGRSRSATCGARARSSAGSSRWKRSAETSVGGRPAVLPRITGQAWIYGTEQLRLDDRDPFPQGFALSDTWGTHLV